MIEEHTPLERPYRFFVDSLHEKPLEFAQQIPQSDPLDRDKQSSLIQFEQSSKSEIFAIYEDILAYVNRRNLIPRKIQSMLELMINEDTFIFREFSCSMTLYSGFSKPDGRKGIATIVIGSASIQRMMKELRDLNSQLRSLPENKLFEVALYSLIAHEFGHCIVRAKLIAEGFEGRESYAAYVNEFFHAIYTDIAPLPQEISDLFDTEESNVEMNPVYTANERILSGFQLIGLELGLQKSDFKPTQIDEALKNFIQNGLVQARKDASILRYAIQKGWEYYDYHKAVEDWIDKLDEAGKKDELTMVASALPLVRHFGYHFPLNIDQIRAFLEL